MVFRSYVSAPAWAGALALSGCASLPLDHGYTPMAQYSAERGLPLPASTATLPASVTRLEQAITLALMYNPDFHREIAGLGFAAAEVYEAGRVSNPTLNLLQLASGNASQFTASVVVGFTDALFLNARNRMAADHFKASQLRVAQAAQNLATEVELAWYTLAAAEQLYGLRQKIAQASRASADLAQRFYEAGNLNARALAVEQAQAGQADVAVKAADLAVKQTQLQLWRWLGLKAEAVPVQPPSLPTPLPEEESLKTLLDWAETSRLDLAAAQTTVSALEQNRGLTRKTRWLGLADVGYERTREFDGSQSQGPVLGLTLPLFNTGAGRLARAEAELKQAEAALLALQLQISRDLASQHAEVLNQKSRLNDFQQTLLSARAALVKTTQREYHYMLVGAFDLIAAKQLEYTAQESYIEALRDYWLARTRLAQAVGKRLNQPTSNVLEAQP